MIMPDNGPSGAHLRDGRTEPPSAVAHGDRRDEVRYEADPAQLVRVRHTFPVADLPPQAQVAAPENIRSENTDTAVVKPSPSVWDASPPED